MFFLAFIIILRVQPGHIYAINIRVEMAKLNFFEMLQIEEEIVIALLGIIFK